MSTTTTDTDFVRRLGQSRFSLVAGREHYERVIGAIREARTSVWIATANLKELRVERRPGERPARYGSILELLDALAGRGVEVRVLHASPPSGPFRAQFDALPRLVAGALDLRQCPRVHAKLVLVDGRFVYLGSANFTGAGLGAKGTGRRNFELGVVSTDEEIVDEAQGYFDHLFHGGECAGCRVRDTCEMPIDAIDAPSPPPAVRVARSIVTRIRRKSR